MIVSSIRMSVALAALMLSLEAFGAETTVTIDGFEFRPPAATVKAGDDVIWRNADPVPHTATAKDAGLDSGSINAGGTYRFIAKRKGRFDYICTLHPTMKGTLIVE